MLATQLMDVFSRAMHDDHSIGQSALLDLVAVNDRVWHSLPHSFPDDIFFWGGGSRGFGEKGA